LATGAFGIESPLVTLGAEVKYAATQYGYLIPDLARGRSNRLTAYPLAAFKEKPTPEVAQDLRQQAGVAWNAGIFMARRRAFLAAFRDYAPDLLEHLGDTFAKPDALAAAYERIQPRSIDYAVMEPAARDGCVVMGAMNVGWSDVGTWAALLDSLVGDYQGEARVVPPSESVDLGPDDICVLREESGARLTCELGPLDEVSSSRPVAFLPAARQHSKVIQALVRRVDAWEMARREASVPLETRA
jgi:hypothetical protein